MKQCMHFHAPYFSPHFATEIKEFYLLTTTKKKPPDFLNGFLRRRLKRFFQLDRKKGIVNNKNRLRRSQRNPDIFSY